MEIPIYQVDAFSSRQFRGNPAAVCPLPSWLPDRTMQAIAAENNLAETAFFVRQGGRYGLRWFTPAIEVELCGHATLAAAYVIFEYLGYQGEQIHFETASGPLAVSWLGDKLALDFPSLPPKRCTPHERLIDGLGTQPLEVLAATKYLAVYASQEEVRSLQPNWDALASLDKYGIIVTAPGANGVDFVSRFFAPAAGINEDPVTGSAHSTLTPYWSRRLGKSSLHALQLSPRGGELWLEDRGDRVTIAGYAAPFLRGTIRID